MSSKLKYEVGHEAGKQHYDSSLSKLINPSWPIWTSHDVSCVFWLVVLWLLPTKGSAISGFICQKLLFWKRFTVGFRDIFNSCEIFALLCFYWQRLHPNSSVRLLKFKFCKVKSDILLFLTWSKPASLTQGWEGRTDQRQREGV